MKRLLVEGALECATRAAQAAGALMRSNFHADKRINQATRHDIKLELDVRSQKLIERTLRRRFSGYAILGEEGVLGDIRAEHRWVVDPIDGTVNFSYGIPHACVSIALQAQCATSSSQGSAGGPHSAWDASYETLVGVVYDPFTDELWTAARGQAARLNGRIIKVSRRRRLREAVIGLGFAKYGSTLNIMLPILNRLVRRVRKIRLMGAAALGMVYVASGRFDAYLEHGLRLWDIAAGGLILECAGGDFWHEALPREHYAYRVLANNGLLRQPLGRVVR